MNETIKKKTKGTPDEIDVHVGGRLRLRRSLLGVSQEKLANAIGLTFQQVQKYEKGLNRISAGRLYQFSKILEIPIAYFYENIPSAQPSYGLSDNDQDGFDHESNEDVMNTKETAILLRAYYSIEDEGTRKDILKFIKSMAQKLPK